MKTILLVFILAGIPGFSETAKRVGMFIVEPVTSFSTVLTGFSLQFAPNGAFTVVTPFEAL